VKLKSEYGVTILEVIIAASILAFGALGVDYFFVERERSLVSLRGYSSRDKILDTVRTAAGLTSSIRNSYYFGDNPSLAACMRLHPSFGVPNPAFDDCPNNAPQDIYLFGPLITGGGPPTFSAEVTGTTLHPVFYDLTGQTCLTKGVGDCVLQATSNFVAQCPPQFRLGPPAPKCDVAETITVNYTVQPIPGVTNASLQNFDVIQGSITTSVQQIAGIAPSTNTVWPVPTPYPPGATPPPPANPNPTIDCPGNTQQFGMGCACPWGDVLIDPFNAVCQHVGF
jgi:hypothetical protein